MLSSFSWFSSWLLSALPSSLRPAVASLLTSLGPSVLPALLPTLGLAVLVWRLTVRGRSAEPVVPEERDNGGLWPSVSLIIPARNEAANLPRLLRSLAWSAYPKLEIIVVDDRSTDATAQLAAAFPVRVIAGAERPMAGPAWGGKQWACAQGAAAATGDILLFTDADTEHLPDSVERAVSSLRGAKAGMLSAAPYHLNPKFWERLLGPFQLLLLAMTAPYGHPRSGRVFAIGQYLMFERAAYAAIGGHASVAAAMVEDLPLANRALDLGIAYHVYRGPPLYRVRMYATLGEFIAGWRRNFRAGFSYARPLAGLDATLFIAALSGGFSFTPAAVVVMAITALYIAARQRELGRFSAFGAVLWPVSVALFCWISLLAMVDKLGRRDLRWKGRRYAAIATPDAVEGRRAAVQSP